MARMIPDVVTPSCTSPGEVELFDRLKREPATKEWIALHSLDIAQHLKRVSGEADFVVIVPALGVLCLEVKACRTVRRDDGLWYYGSESRGDARGPFRQASEAMHSIRQRVVRAAPELSRVPFWSAVVFPYLEFEGISGEWHSWQVIDKPELSKQPLATLLRAVLRIAREHLAVQRSANWFRDGERLPTTEQCAAIARILRPSFEFSEKPPDRRARLQREIVQFTEEQFAALDALGDNERVLFTGPAGTGKTLLAIEAARRATSSGEKVLFLCYNRLLGRWLLKHPFFQNSTVTVGTFHQYLLALSGESAPEGAGDDYWSTHLPELAVTKLLEGSPDAESFDLLILDEVQDLARSQYLDVLEYVLKGGLKNGRWLLFGDFERQMLYGQARQALDDVLRLRLGSSAKCSLRVNCRNTPRIASLSHLLGKLTPQYSRVLRPDDRIEPTLSYYATPSQQRKELAAILSRLERESYSCEDIVVLSPKAAPRSAAATLDDPTWQNRLKPIEEAMAGCVSYTTIHSFKGMEAPAVIVTDIEHLDGEHFSSLFYVATSRALERLCVLVHETAKPEIVAALLGSG